MPGPPALRFLSLFVPDLGAAARDYEALLGAPPLRDPGAVPDPHPFAKGPPVVFAAGPVLLALYACDGKTTHPGDVGIGLVAEDDAASIEARAKQARARVFHAGELTLAVTQDRHFFEIVKG